MITDGVVAFADQPMLENTLQSLRRAQIQCSFIQTDDILLGRGRDNQGHVPAQSLGHVPDSGLLHFIASSTGGALLFDNGSLYRGDNGKSSTDTPVEAPPMAINLAPSWRYPSYGPVCRVRAAFESKPDVDEPQMPFSDAPAVSPSLMMNQTQEALLVAIFSCKGRRDVPENVKFCVPEEVLTSGNESLCSLDVSENGCDKTTRPSPVAIVRRKWKSYNLDLDVATLIEFRLREGYQIVMVKPRRGQQTEGNILEESEVILELDFKLHVRLECIISAIHSDYVSNDDSSPPKEMPSGLLNDDNGCKVSAEHQQSISNSRTQQVPPDQQVKSPIQQQYRCRVRFDVVASHDFHTSLSNVRKQIARFGLRTASAMHLIRVLESTVEADLQLSFISSFSMHSDVVSVPTGEDAVSDSVFIGSSSYPTSITKASGATAPASTFVRFWELVLAIPETTQQFLLHTEVISAALVMPRVSLDAQDGLHYDIKVCQRAAFDALKSRLKSWTSFALLPQTFVKIVETSWMGQLTRSFMLVCLTTVEGMVFVWAGFCKISPAHRAQLLLALKDEIGDVRYDGYNGIRRLDTADRKSNSCTQGTAHMPEDSMNENGPPRVSTDVGIERSSGRGLERSSGRGLERSSGRGLERSSGRSLERQISQDYESRARSGQDSNSSDENGSDDVEVIFCTPSNEFVAPVDDDDIPHSSVEEDTRSPRPQISALCVPLRAGSPLSVLVRYKALPITPETFNDVEELEGPISRFGSHLARVRWLWRLARHGKEVQTEEHLQGQLSAEIIEWMVQRRFKEGFNRLGRSRLGTVSLFSEATIGDTAALMQYIVFPPSSDSVVVELWVEPQHGLVSIGEDCTCVKKVDWRGLIDRIFDIDTNFISTACTFSHLKSQCRLTAEKEDADEVYTTVDLSDPIETRHRQLPQTVLLSHAAYAYIQPVPLVLDISRVLRVCDSMVLRFPCFVGTSLSSNVNTDPHHEPFPPYFLVTGQAAAHHKRPGTQSAIWLRAHFVAEALKKECNLEIALDDVDMTRITAVLVARYGLQSQAESDYRMFADLLDDNRLLFTLVTVPKALRAASGHGSEAGGVSDDTLEPLEIEWSNQLIIFEGSMDSVKQFCDIAYGSDIADDVDDSAAPESTRAEARTNPVDSTIQERGLDGADHRFSPSDPHHERKPMRLPACWTEELVIDDGVYFSPMREINTGLREPKFGEIHGGDNSSLVVDDGASLVKNDDLQMASSASSGTQGRHGDAPPVSTKSVSSLLNNLYNATESGLPGGTNPFPDQGSFENGSKVYSAGMRGQMQMAKSMLNRSFVSVVYVRAQEGYGVSLEDANVAIESCESVHRELDITEMLLHLVTMRDAIAVCGVPEQNYHADIKARFTALLQKQFLPATRGGGLWALSQNGAKWLAAQVKETRKENEKKNTDGDEKDKDAGDSKADTLKPSERPGAGDAADGSGADADAADDDAKKDDDIDTIAQEEVDPIFLTLECSLKRRAKSGASLYTEKQISDLPCSLSELVDEAADGASDLKEALIAGHVTVLLHMTMYYLDAGMDDDDADFGSRTDDPLSTRGRQQRRGSMVSSSERSGDSTPIAARSRAGSVILTEDSDAADAVFVTDMDDANWHTTAAYRRLSMRQLKAIDTLELRIGWLIADEVLSLKRASRDLGSKNTETFDATVEHLRLGKSISDAGETKELIGHTFETNTFVKRIPLKFVDPESGPASFERELNFDDLHGFSCTWHRGLLWIRQIVGGATASALLAARLIVDEVPEKYEDKSTDWELPELWDDEPEQDPVAVAARSFCMWLEILPDQIVVWFHTRAVELDVEWKLVAAVEAIVVRACKRTNELVLLNECDATKVCDPRLVVPAQATAEAIASAAAAAAKTGAPDDQQMTIGPLGCRLVFRRSFPLHWRLSAKDALAAITNALFVLRVTNRDDQFVYRERYTDAVFLLCFTTTDRGDKRAGDDGENNDDGREAVQLDVYGVRAVGAGIGRDLIAMLANLVDGAALSALSERLSRSSTMKLTTADVDFLKRTDRHAANVRLPVPSFIADRFVLLYYFRQLVLQYLLPFNGPEVLTGYEKMHGFVSKALRTFVYNNWGGTANKVYDRRRQSRPTAPHAPGSRTQIGRHRATIQRAPGAAVGDGGVGITAGTGGSGSAHEDRRDRVRDALANAVGSGVALVTVEQCRPTKLTTQEPNRTGLGRSRGDGGDDPVFCRSTETSQAHQSLCDLHAELHHVNADDSDASPTEKEHPDIVGQLCFVIDVWSIGIKDGRVKALTDMIVRSMNQAVIEYVIERQIIPLPLGCGDRPFAKAPRLLNYQLEKSLDKLVSLSASPLIVPDMQSRKFVIPTGHTTAVVSQLSAILRSLSDEFAVVAFAENTDHEIESGASQPSGTPRQLLYPAEPLEKTGSTSKPKINSWDSSLQPDYKSHQGSRRRTRQLRPAPSYASLTRRYSSTVCLFAAPYVTTGIPSPILTQEGHGSVDDMEAAAEAEAVERSPCETELSKRMVAFEPCSAETPETPDTGYTRRKHAPSVLRKNEKPGCRHGPCCLMLASDVCDWTVLALEEVLASPLGPLDVDLDKLFPSRKASASFTASSAVASTHALRDRAGTLGPDIASGSTCGNGGAIGAQGVKKAGAGPAITPLSTKELLSCEPVLVSQSPDPDDQSIEIPRHCFVTVSIESGELRLLTYNLIPAVVEKLNAAVDSLIQWSNKRANVLSRIIFSKMGLYDHMQYYYGGRRGHIGGVTSSAGITSDVGGDQVYSRTDQKILSGHAANNRLRVSRNGNESSAHRSFTADVSNNRDVQQQAHEADFNRMYTPVKTNEGRFEPFSIHEIKLLIDHVTPLPPSEIPCTREEAQNELHGECLGLSTDLVRDPISTLHGWCEREPIDQSVADPVRRHGGQLVVRYEKLSRSSRFDSAIDALHRSWLETSDSGGPQVSNAIELNELMIVKRLMRPIHYCATPVLFHPGQGGKHGSFTKHCVESCDTPHSPLSACPDRPISVDGAQQSPALHAGTSFPAQFLCTGGGTIPPGTMFYACGEKSGGRPVYESVGEGDDDGPWSELDGPDFSSVPRDNRLKQVMADLMLSGWQAGTLLREITRRFDGGGGLNSSWAWRSNHDAGENANSESPSTNPTAGERQPDNIMGSVGGNISVTDNGGKPHGFVLYFAPRLHEDGLWCWMILPSELYETRRGYACAMLPPGNELSTDNNTSQQWYQLESAGGRFVPDSSLMLIPAASLQEVAQEQAWKAHIMEQYRTLYVEYAVQRLKFRVICRAGDDVKPEHSMRPERQLMQADHGQVLAQDLVAPLTASDQLTKGHTRSASSVSQHSMPRLTGNQSTTATSIAPPASAGPSIDPTYLQYQRRLKHGGGLILLEISSIENFVCIKMHAHSTLKSVTNSSSGGYDMGTDAVSTSEASALFTRECNDLKDFMHVHSFGYDFNVHALTAVLVSKALPYPRFQYITILRHLALMHPEPPDYAHNNLQIQEMNLSVLQEKMGQTRFIETGLAEKLVAYLSRNATEHGFQFMKTEGSGHGFVHRSNSSTVAGEGVTVALVLARDLCASGGHFNASTAGADNLDVLKYAVLRCDNKNRFPRQKLKAKSSVEEQLALNKRMGYSSLSGHGRFEPIEVPFSTLVAEAEQWLSGALRSALRLYRRDMLWEKLQKSAAVGVRPEADLDVIIRKEELWELLSLSHVRNFDTVDPEVISVQTAVSNWTNLLEMLRAKYGSCMVLTGLGQMEQKISGGETATHAFIVAPEDVAAHLCWDGAAGRVRGALVHRVSPSAQAKMESIDGERFCDEDTRTPLNDGDDTDEVLAPDLRLFSSVINVLLLHLFQNI